MAGPNFHPFPVLETKRLQLRALDRQDDRQIFLLRSDEVHNQYVDRPRAHSLEDAQKFIKNIENGIRKNESLYWAISLKNEPGLIGTICLWNLSIEKNKGEIGFELLPSFQGKGFMQEAFESVVRYGFEAMHLQTIEAWVRSANSKSIKILEQNHFKRSPEAEALLTEEEKQKGMRIYTREHHTNE